MKEIPIRITIITRDIDAAAQKADQKMTDLERKIHRGFKSAQTSVNKFQSFVMGTVAALGSLAAAAYAVKASFDAALRFEALQRAYETIYSGAMRANEQLQWLYEVSSRVGTQFQESAASAKTFFAAGQGTTLEADMNRIYESVSKAGASLALSQETLNGVFLALGQMISKGNVQAEELRGQLGERLPGAFRLAAEAMGVTTGQLDKMLELGQVTAEDLLPKLADALDRKYAGGVSEAVKSTANLSTEWERFKAAASNTDGIVAAIQAVTATLKEAADAMRDAKTAAELARQGIEADGFSASDRAAAALGGGGADLDFSTGGYSRETLDRYQKYGVTDPADESLVRLSEAQRQREAQSAVALDNALGKARESSDAFLKSTKAYKEAKIDAEYDKARKAIENYIAKAKEAGDTESANDWTKKLGELATEHDRQVKALDKAGSSANKADSARASIIEKLAQMTDTGTGEVSRIASLQKEYDSFAKTLGKGNADVRAFADALEYAKSHSGYTQSEVAEFTREADKQLAAMRDRAEAIQQATLSDGTVDNQRLAYLEAIAEAQRQYTEDVEKVGVAKAEELKAMREQAATTQQRQEDLAVQQSFYESLASLYDADEKYKRDLLDKQVETYRKAGVAETDLAKWRYKQELEIATDAYSGIQRALQSYADGTKDYAKAMEDATLSAFGKMEDAIIEFTNTGKLSVNDMVNSIVADLQRMAVRGAITGPLSEAMSGVWSQFGGAAASSASNLAGGLSSGASAGELSSAFSKDTPTVSGGGFFSGMWDKFSSLFGFAEGGSFEVSPRTALASMGNGSLDNRVIAFRARDGERVTVTKPGQSVGGSSVNMNVYAQDANSFRRSENQILSRLGTAVNRANKRNG